MWSLFRRLDYLLKGDKMLTRMGPSNGFIPLIKADAHKGFIKNLEKEDYLEDSDWYRLPGFNPAEEQFLFEVEGDGMVPTLLPGDIVICQKQPNIDHVLDGSVVLLVTSGKLRIKRIRLHNNSKYFLLEDDGEEQEKERIPKSEIRQVMIVRGKLSSLLVPHHQLASKGKIAAMEEATEFLKRELFMVTKKLNSMKN